MEGLAKACKIAILAAETFLVCMMSPNALCNGISVPELSDKVLPFPTLLISVNWFIAYRNQIIGSLMITIIMLLVLYIRQRKEHTQHTHQLENLVSARTQELEQANADLKRLSITDPLTGAKNRRFVEFSITEELARIRRSTQNAANEWENAAEESISISFLMIDIDFFKLINDRYGHAAGDQVLRQMSTLFTSMVRESDTTVRWGGEEFLIIARNPRRNDTAILAERLRKRVASYPFAISEQQAIRVTCSIGFASWPFFNGDPDVLDWEKVVALADCGLYKAKNNGRNAWCGIIAQPGRKGKVTSKTLDDLDAAEKKGLIIFQSSYDSIVGQNPSSQDAKPHDIQPQNDLSQRTANLS